jgi:hypothetical protein
MAGADESKRPEKSFDASTPLDSRHLRAWVEHLATRLKDTDSVEVTLINNRRSGRRTVSFEAPINPSYNLCPLRRGLPPEPPEQPTPKPKPRGSGGG